MPTIIAIAHTSYGYIYILTDKEGRKILEFSLSYTEDILLRNKYNPIHSVYTGKGKVRDHKHCLTDLSTLESTIARYY